ncbi:MAG: type II secretion system F family protein [Thermoplasmata archaeon]|nr:type II secretion system F family protein [Thermoplasmata archaeon]
MSTTVKRAVVTATDSSDGTASKPATPVVSKYRTFCYRLLGERFDAGEGRETITEQLQRAGMTISPGMHYSVEIVTSVIAAVVGFVISLLLFAGVLHTPNWYLYVLVITAIAAGATIGGFNFLITSRIANRKDELDRELPFTLSELSVLASTGTSPIRLVRRMAARDHDPAMTAEFKRVVYKADIQGKDLITALAETAKESASTSVREAFWDLANMIHQGGNLDEYLRTKSDDVMKLRRSVQEEFIDRLTTFLDMYVSLVLTGILLLAVAAFLINALGSTAGGLNANELLLLLTFGLVPVSVAMTIILISIAYARAE